MSMRNPGPRRNLNLPSLPAASPAELVTRLTSMPIGDSATFGWDDRHAQHVATITRVNDSDFLYAHDGVCHNEMTDTAEHAALALLVHAVR
jgi:hypothetical protein